MTQSLAHSYQSEPSSVAAARADVVSFASGAGAPDPLIDGLRLAVSEAVTNAVQHAYPVGRGSVRVLANLGDEGLEVIVSDDGCGVHSRSRTAGLGVGLALIAEMSDEMTLAPRTSGGTEVRMRFGLGLLSSGGAVGRL